MAGDVVAMRRAIHQSIAIWLLLLYAPMVFMGTAGLHELLGCRHGACPLHEHDGQEESGQRAFVANSHGETSHGAETCLICHWYSLVQQSPAVAGVDRELPLVQAATFCEAPGYLPRSSHRERLPRAPPPCAFCNA